MAIVNSTTYFNAATPADERTYKELPAVVGAPTNSYARYARFQKAHVQDSSRCCWILRTMEMARGHHWLVCLIIKSDSYYVKEKYKLAICGRLGRGASDNKEISNTKLAHDRSIICFRD